MNRRDFLRAAGIVSAGAALGRSSLLMLAGGHPRSRALGDFAPRAGRRRFLAQSSTPAAWRVFDITTRVHVLKPAGPTRVWLPMPLAVATYQKTLGDTYQVPGGRATMVENDDLDLLMVEWAEGIEPTLTITNRVATTPHAANLSTPTVPPPLDARVFARFLRPGRLMPADGVTETTSGAITRSGGTDIERARALYDWIVHKPSGDGARPNLNTQYVALARASGIPARAVWGIRVAPSPHATPGRGRSDDATHAQHCRAEVYLTGYGWVPVDAADATFGSWEMNWVAYNYAHDIVLPGSKRGAVAVFTSAQGETANGRLDSRDPDSFSYQITTNEL